MVPRRVAKTLLCIGVASVLFPAGTVRASTRPVRLATQDIDKPLQVRPRLVSYTGDGTGYLAGRKSSPKNYERGGLSWLRWSHQSAVARGFDWLNNCRPSCADGRFSKHRATVLARRPRHGLFTRLVIKFRFRGGWRFDHRALIYASGYYSWGICGNRFTPSC